MASTNPVLTSWNQSFGLPNYSAVSDSDFSPALDEALTTANAQLDSIVDNPKPASFDNTMLALEKIEGMGSDLEKVCALFYSISSTCSTPEREQLEMEFGAKLSTFNSQFMSNEVLFKRVETVWKNKESLSLIQQRRVDLSYHGFIRGGASLDEADKKRLAKIMARLSELGTKFVQTVLDDEREWFMELDEKAISELPEFVQDACKSAGEERGNISSGHVVTLSRSIIVPFLQFSPNRDLRKQAYLAWTSRGEGQDDKDNVRRATEILQLREERAKLMGFGNFAKYKLDAEMAKTPEAVRELLMQVWNPALKHAQADAKTLQERLHADGYNIQNINENANESELQAWDWHYYSEARRKEEHDLDEAEIKPYFQLDKMIEACFDCANRLFGLEFAKIPTNELTAWHEDCRAWNITRDGEHMAVFIGDYFTRAGKRSGAWCTSLLSQYGLLGTADSHRPQVINVCNFSKNGVKGEEGKSLLSYDDAITLFHEFGHALHAILSNVEYQSIAGLNVERDFVELPSQLYEHWLSVPDVLDRFATHVDTGKPIPTYLRDRLLSAQTYNAGFATVEFLATAIVDLELHDQTAPANALEEQTKILQRIGMPPQIRMRHATPNLMHTFSSDGYSSGYYSYLWAEVMDADAFDAFTETGNVFDADTAKRLEGEIYSRGTTRSASEHYTAFRGRMPGVEPLLKGRGLF